MITLLPTSDRSVTTDEMLAKNAGETVAPNAATDPAQRVSSHRTSQGHVVYYRCYCGEPRVLVMRWTFSDASGSRRLAAQWAPTCPTCTAA